MNKALALLLCAALPTLATAAQPDVEALTLDPRNKLYCNEQADWCVGIKVDGGFEENGPFASSRTLRAEYRLWDLPEIPDFSHFTVWPHLIRLSEERALVGVIGPSEPDYKEEIQFPGGSFSRRDLYLFAVDLGDRSSNLAQMLPYATQASVRACVNEADERRRAASAPRPPAWGCQGKACGDPCGWCPADADPAKQPAPTAAQRQPQADKQCSYTVTYKWQADDSVYKPTTPLPDCAEFLQARPAKG